MLQLDLEQHYLDFVIDPIRGDRWRWRWDFPLAELWFDAKIISELIIGPEQQTHEIYPAYASMCTACDFIDSINGVLEQRELDWQKHGDDPGRLEVLSSLGVNHFDLQSSLSRSHFAFKNESNKSGPWPSTNTWLFPHEGEWLLSVTTKISRFDYPDEDDETAIRMAMEAYQQNYRILYQHRITTEMLEAWREQARAFMRQIYSHLDEPWRIP